MENGFKVMATPEGCLSLALNDLLGTNADGS